MKKGLIGCLVVALLLFAAGCGLAYWFLFRSGSAVASSVESFSQIAKAAEATAEIKNTSTFEPPADGTLTAAQVAMFIGVQEQVQAKLGSDMQALQAKGEAIEAKAKAEERDVGATEGMALLGDMTALLAKAKGLQAEALNKYNTSLSEYEWVRGQIYAAYPYATMDTIPPQMMGADVNAANIALVKPHQDVVGKAMANGMVGL